MATLTFSRSRAIQLHQVCTWPWSLGKRQANFAMRSRLGIENVLVQRNFSYLATKNDPDNLLKPNSGDFNNCHCPRIRIAKYFPQKATVHVRFLSTSKVSSASSPELADCDRTCSDNHSKKRDQNQTLSLSQFVSQRQKHFSVRREQRMSGTSESRRIIHPLLGGTMTQPLTVCVEGNIGSGKTTFLKHFKSNPEVCVFDEPISKWRDCQGYNLLDLMYKDPKKWSLCFQSYVQLTMLDLHTKPVAQPIKMMERSIYSAQYCFVKNLREEGLMDEAQYAVLSEWFNFSTTNLPIKLDLIVYLRTDPEVAYKRIAERGRFEENSITMEYLQSVHELHENWLVRNQKLLPCPVLTIDANLDLEDMAPNYLLCEERLFQKPAVANC